MLWDNAYECEPRKRGPYLMACDAIWLGYPRYTVNWGDLDQKEIESVWKRAKRCVLA